MPPLHTVHNRLSAASNRFTYANISPIGHHQGIRVEWLLLLKYTSLTNSLLAIIYKSQSSMMKSRGDLSSQVEEPEMRNPREIMRVFSVRPFTNVIVILQRTLSNIKTLNRMKRSSCSEQSSFAPEGYSLQSTTPILAIGLGSGEQIDYVERYLGHSVKSVRNDCILTTVKCTLLHAICMHDPDS